MRNLFCAVCFQSVNYKQNTCGGFACLDTWKHYSTETRRKRKNLASMTPSERDFALRNEPEVEPDIEFLDNLRTDALIEAKSKNKTPNFIREMLSPENFPIVDPNINDKEETNDNPTDSPSSIHNTDTPK